MIWRRNKPSAIGEEKPKGFDDFELRLGDVMRGERATLGKSLLDVQRDLKIKATYIAAIENCDTSAFETQGFVAGFVRSYARYLGMDPDWAFKRFCVEANFEVAHGMSAAASPAKISAARNRTVEYRDPLADPNAIFVPRGESMFSRVEPGAIGSLLVLIALIGGLGYGGWSVLQEVQRVQLAPVDQAPSVVADLDPLSAVQGDAPLSVAEMDPLQSDGAPMTMADNADAINRLYRPEALDIPVLERRDGPISAIDPRIGGQVASAAGAVAPVIAGAEAPLATDAVQVVANAAPGVEILAVRSSWVRVSAADGTVLFEKILDAGERYAVPQMEEAAALRSGNSGAIYFSVNGQTYGPAAPGAQVVKNVTLSPEAVTAKFALADLSEDADLSRIVNVAQLAPETLPLAPLE